MISNVTEYVISYGYHGNDWRFGATKSLYQSSGVESLTIHHLDPYKEYWFTVRAGNGCATGEFSNWLQARPGIVTHKY